MAALFGILCFVSFICLILGFFIPKKILFWGEKLKRTRKKAALIYGLATIIFFILIGVSSSDASTQTTASPSTNGASPSTNTSAEKTSPAKPSKPTKTLTESEIPQMFKDPNTFKGDQATIKGQVTNENMQLGNMTVFQMQVGSNNTNVIVDVGSNGPMENQDTFVQVTGIVKGQLEGTNAFGGDIKAPVIKLNEVKKVSAMSVLSPTIKEVSPSKTTTQFSVSVTINKIQYAKDETRVYVNVKNASKSTVDIFGLSSKAIQDGKQIDATMESHYEIKLPQLTDQLLPGASSSGVIVFNAMDPTKPVTFNLDVSSENYNYNFNLFKFDIANH